MYGYGDGVGGAGVARVCGCVQTGVILPEKTERDDNSSQLHVACPAVWGCAQVHEANVAISRGSYNIFVVWREVHVQNFIIMRVEVAQPQVVHTYPSETFHSATTWDGIEQMAIWCVF